MTKTIQYETGVGDIARAIGNSSARDTGFAFDYQFDLPEGEWTGRLIAKSWGKSSNLICYFEDINTLKKYKISAFKSRKFNGYRPMDDGVDFGIAGIEGNIYCLVTGKNKKENPAWKSALLKANP